MHARRRRIRPTAAVACRRGEPCSAARYRLVVLSDHGQSQGATFLDRYGSSLEQLVREKLSLPGTPMPAASAKRVRPRTRRAAERGEGFLAASLAEIAGGASWMSKAVRGLAGAISIVRICRPGNPEDARASARPPEFVVMASGCWD